MYSIIMQERRLDSEEKFQRPKEGGSDEDIFNVTFKNKITSNGRMNPL